MRRDLTTRNDPFDLFDPFDDFFKPMFFDESKSLKTNIRENEENYELDLALPGYAKDEIKVSLDGGYLTVSARKEKKEENGRYLCREIQESTSRSYYVGNGITGEEIKAKYENGILSLTVPKEQPRKLKHENVIAIE